MGKFKVAESKKPRKENEKIETQINRLFIKIAHVLMDIYVLFFLCIFPLCMRDKYFDILTFRFNLFWKPTFTYGIIFTIILILYLLSDSLYNKGALRRKFFEGLNESAKKCDTKKGFFHRAFSICRYLHITTVDVLFTILIVFFSISTALAEYPYEAFWGDRGRNQGLLIWLMFYLAYILISRFYRFKKWHIYSYMLFSSIVCIWGIFNFFLVTFGMFDGADDVYRYTFASSIGNINTYTNFTAMLYGVSAAVFVSSKGITASIFAYIVLTIASFAQIMGISDNVILSTGIVLATLPIIFWNNKHSIIRYVIVCLTYISALKITSCIVKSGIHTMNKTKESIQISLADKDIITILITVLAIILIILVLTELKFFSKKKNEEISSDYDAKIINRLRLVWITFIVLGSIVVIVILFLANTGWHEDIWKPLSNALIINDDWGTGRGLNWRLGMEYWKNDATFLQKIFGYGPDTYYIITMDRFMNIMQDAGYGMFDSAHNEYFEYFITVGVIGLAAYQIFLYKALKEMIYSSNTISKCLAVGVLAYAFQAVINIAVPITTPVFMTLTFLGIATSENRNINRNYIVD